MATHEPLFTSTHQLSPPLRVIRSFLLVWLDGAIDETNDIDSRNTITELQHVVNTIDTFVNVDQCVSFLRNTRNEKIFLIVSGSFGQNIVPVVHHLVQLTSIYIFCEDKSRYEHWTKKWPKVRGVFTDIIPICNLLKQAAQQNDRNSISISFVSKNSEISTAKLNQLDQSYMYTQILKEILLDIDFSKKSVKDFTKFCREQFANNEKELNLIGKFERKYRHSTPIWWYTNECFLHSMLNRALRMMEVDIIIKMGFFIRDLHCHIEKLHNEQYKNASEIQSFIVYRGQGLSNSDFDKMKKTKGGLISFNNFISSSKKRNVALMFAHHACDHSDLIGIVFTMMIDPAISSTPFALVNDVSFYKTSEQEILFSMHTIFRIGEITQIEDNNHQLWEIELTLTSDNDQQLNALTQRMREETRGVKGWYSMGQLLLKLGQFDKAEELYKVLLNHTSNDCKIANIYHQLGWIKKTQGHYVEAISFFEKSLAIGKKILPKNHPDLATSYDNIGLVYQQMGEYNKALSSHEKALEIYQAIHRPDLPDLATTLNNIGVIYYKLDEYSRALSFYQEALEIYKTLPSIHPSLGTSYNNIGLVYDKMNDYSKALWFYEKTLEIYRRTLPANHLDLAVPHQNIGKALEKMCEYSKALSFHEKALAILQNNLPSNHPHLAICYSYIASVYNNMHEYSKALPFYEKALDLRQLNLPGNHPDLITSYNNIGGVYESMNEYLKALSFYQKALAICERVLASHHPTLAATYNNIANVYYKIGCYNEALPYAEHAVNIGLRALPPNHSDLQIYYKILELIKNML